MSGGVSSASGKSTQTQESSSANALAALAQQFSGETTGVRTGLLEAMQEVLSTGGSSIPIISSAIESSRKASSRALDETKQSLAQSGVAGTPYGENVLATQRQEGELNVAKTKDSLAQNIFGMISNFVLGQSQTATSGLSAAISGDTTTRERAKGSAADVGFNKK